MRDPEHVKAVGLLALCALCWSLAGVLFKHVDWPPLAIAGGRALVAAVFLLAVKGRSLRFTFSRQQLGATLAFTGCTIPFAVANKLTTAANAILLQYTAPVWVALFGAWFLGEKTTRRDWLALGAVAAGLALFFAEGVRLEGLVGNLLAVFSGVSFAAMAMLMRKQRDSSPLEAIILGNLLGAAIGLPAAVGEPLPSPTGLLALGALGLVQLGIPYLLYAKAIRHVTALEAVLIPVIEPVLNPIWVVIFVGERPHPLALAGGAIIVAAVTWRTVAALQRPDNSAVKSSP
jgi:drug/metabolite transporter (DMT)-like permease